MSQHTSDPATLRLPFKEKLAYGMGDLGSNILLDIGTLYLLKITPSAVLSAGTTQLIRLTWLIAFIVLLVSSAALFIISARFTAPIVHLVQHMERIGQGDMTDPISTTRIDEIGRLITQF